MNPTTNHMNAFVTYKLTTEDPSWEALAECMNLLMSSIEPETDRECLKSIIRITVNGEFRREDADRAVEFLHRLAVLAFKKTTTLPLRYPQEVREAIRQNADRADDTADAFAEWFTIQSARFAVAVQEKE